MNAATYTKIAKTTTYGDESMSLGFRRFHCLPNPAQMNIKIAYLMQTGSLTSHDYVVSFFGSMTEAEYKQYIITH